MSDKTTVPGMEGSYQNYNFGPNTPNPNPSRDPFGMQQGVQGGTYGTSLESGGTVVGGFGNPMPNMPQSHMQSPVQSPMQMPMQGSFVRPQRDDQPVYGFLYSVSRVPTGEFWPVYQGNNTIGRDATCDVYLPEATVSRQHLSLVIRKNRNPEKIIAAIRDLGSTEGTMLNGQSLEFDVVECRNGDMITVGQSYELLFILVDTVGLGLKQAENFIPAGPAGQPQMPNMGNMGNMQYMQPSMPSQMPSSMPTQMGGAPQMNPGYDSSIPPSFRPENIQPTTPRYTPSDGTVGLDGGFGNNSNRGGTEIMP